MIEAATLLLALAVIGQAIYIRRLQTDWFRERQDLLNRIMAADWQGYKANTTVSGPPPKGGSFLSGHRRELERIRKITGGDR